MVPTAGLVSAGTAAMPATVATVGSGLLGPIGLAVGGAALLARAIPNRFERQYRRQIKELGKQLARGEGGMSETDRQQALARGAQQVESATAQQQAQLARGAATGAGASGMQQQAIRELSQGKQKAMGQIGSAIQKQDLALRDAMKQQYMAGLRDQGFAQRMRVEKTLQESQKMAPQMYEQAQYLGAQRRSRTGEGTLAQAQSY